MKASVGKERQEKKNEEARRLNQEKSQRHDRTHKNFCPESHSMQWEENQRKEIKGQRIGIQQAKAAKTKIRGRMMQENQRKWRERNDRSMSESWSDSRGETRMLDLTWNHREWMRWDSLRTLSHVQLSLWSLWHQNIQNVRPLLLFLDVSPLAMMNRKMTERFQQRGVWLIITRKSRGCERGKRTDRNIKSGGDRTARHTPSGTTSVTSFLLFFPSLVMFFLVPDSESFVTQKSWVRIKRLRRRSKRKNLPSLFLSLVSLDAREREGIPFLSSCVACFQSALVICSPLNDYMCRYPY